MKIGIVQGWSIHTPGKIVNVIEMTQQAFTNYAGPDDLLELSGSEWIGWTVNINRSTSPPPAPTVPVEETYQKLWQAAHDYEYVQISGSAIGLITLGLIQGKPKCAAVQAWIRSIWTLYYMRKAAVTTAPPLDVVFDFTSVGPCPYSVPELMAELGM